MINGIIGTNDALDALAGVLKGWKKSHKKVRSSRGGRPPHCGGCGALRYASGSDAMSPVPDPENRFFKLHLSQEVERLIMLSMIADFWRRYTGKWCVPLCVS